MVGAYIHHRKEPGWKKRKLLIMAPLLIPVLPEVMMIALTLKKAREDLDDSAT